MIPRGPVSTQRPLPAAVTLIKGHFIDFSSFPISHSQFLYLNSPRALSKLNHLHLSPCLSLKFSENLKQDRSCPLHFRKWEDRLDKDENTLTTGQQEIDQCSMKECGKTTYFLDKQQLNSYYPHLQGKKLKVFEGEWGHGGLCVL